MCVPCVFVLQLATIFVMRFTIAVLLALTTAAVAQKPPGPTEEPEQKSVTVPIALDHNRIITDAYLVLPNGTTQRVHAWIDTGNPDLHLSRRLATLLGLAVRCGEQACASAAPREISIGNMRISLSTVKEATIPLKPGAGESFMFPGMSAEITIPSSVLRNYDLLINYPGHELSIAQPGSLKFQGVKQKMLINATNGLIQIPSKIENKKYNLALDLGSSISFLAEEVFDKLANGHSDWPHMSGAVGPANICGSDDEVKRRLMRVERLQFGPLYLTNVALAAFEKDETASFEKRAGIATAGLLGADALLNYRVGLDYAHSTVYYDIGRTFIFPEFDVAGLILRPEVDGKFTIVGIADYDGNASIPPGQDGVQVGDHLVAVDGIPVSNSTMGQVWSSLGGEPGKERTLSVERGGRQFIVVAKVRRFLREKEDNDATTEKPHRN
jgi:hypothetical protein